MATGDVQFTLHEASLLLPPLTEDQLRELVHALRWKPRGHRRDGRPGRPAPVYLAADLFRLHGAVLPLIGDAQ